MEIKEDVKIGIFPPKTERSKVLSSNGYVLDNICIECKVTENPFTGNYILDGVFLQDKNLSKKIIQESILKVKLDYGYEIFRINKIDPTTRDITIVARQITISETLSLWLDDIRPMNTNGMGALNHMLTNATGVKEIFVTSDIETEGTAYYQKMSMYKAIHDCDQSFTNRWGGEFLRRGYNLSILNRVGSDHGVTIREGKNLLGFSGSTNMDELVTRAQGQGYNGLYGDYIDSPLINKYARVYTTIFNYDDVKVKTDDDPEGFDTEEDAKNELNKRVKAEFSENNVDELKGTYDIDFVLLEQTEEYKNYVQSERALPGDVIGVYIPSLDFTIKLRMAERVFNVLTQRVDSATLTNVPEKTGVAIDTATILQDIKNKLINSGSNNIAEYVNDMINSGQSDSYAIARQNEFLIMDTKDINTAINVWRWNKGGLAHSSTGYYGKYTIGLTADGILNANIIRTGILTTILIQNADGSFQIDLSGSGGASFLNNGKLAIRMENNALNFYNWAKDGDYIGALTALCRDENGKSNPNKPSVGIVNDTDSYFTISYAKENNDSQFLSYIDFDKYNVLKTKAIAPIKVHEDVEFNFHSLFNASLKSDTSIPLYVAGNLVALFGPHSMTLNVPIYNKNGKLAFDPMAPQGETVDGSNELREKVVNSARKLIGKWYVFGGNYPPLGKDSGTDCSGLMQWAYNDNGIKISRTTYTQIKEGTEVSEGDLKLGDLVFPSTEHVFMYSGEKNGQHMCVEAAHTGTQLRERAFTWGSGYRARRIIKNSSGGHSSPGGTAGSKASSNIIYYVKGIEGFAPNYYYDSVGVKTLGYGMTGGELSGVSTPLSEASATHYLTKYFNRDYYSKVLSIVKRKGVSNPKQREIDAFSSFAYNLGVGAFEESTLLKKYVAGERGESIHNEFKKWVHGDGQVLPGLVRRREEEWKIFSGSGQVAGYNGRPYIDIIGKGGTVTANGGYGASPY